MVFVPLFVFSEDSAEDLKKTIEELEEEIENIKIDLEIMKAESEGEERLFNIYGYFGFRYHDMNFENPNIVQYHIIEEPTFSQTNLNLYFQFNPTDKIEVLSEVRFLYDPKGYPYEDLGEVEPDMNTIQKRDYTYNYMGSIPMPIPVPLLPEGNDAILTNADGMPIDQDGNPIITDEYLSQFFEGQTFNELAFIDDYMTRVIFTGDPAFTTYYLYPAQLPTYFLDFTNALNYSWGAIKIERAWVNIKHKDYLNFKLGKFFTPFGIWNVDHGLPVILSARVPFLLAYVPETQTGVEVHGKYFFPHTTLDYAAYVSNGKGPRPEMRDNDGQLAFGGRLNLSLQQPAFKELSIGASFFMGSYRVDRDSIKISYDPNMGENGMFVTEPFYGSTIEYDETTFGIDFKAHYRSVLVQAEYLNRTHDYSKFEPEESIFTAFAPEDFYSYYVQLGFELPFRPFGLNLTPFVRYEYMDGFLMGAEQSPVTSTPVPDVFNSKVAGLNIRMNPYVVFKLDYTHTEFDESGLKFDLMVASVAVSF